jgi:hypothetical protein
MKIGIDSTYFRKKKTGMDIVAWVKKPSNYRP